MNHLGISCGFHDAAISVVDDSGNIVFAGHSERYSKHKHDKNLCLPLLDDALNSMRGGFKVHYYEKPWLKFLRQVRSGEPIDFKNMFVDTYIGKDIVQAFDNRVISTQSHHESHPQLAVRYRQCEWSKP